MFGRKKILSNKDISPDEIFLDSRNIPGFYRENFEGVIEKAIPRRTPALLSVFVGLALLGLLARVEFLQIEDGEYMLARSLENRLRLEPLIAERGIIYDRFGKELAWNEASAEDKPRVYADMPGLSHVLGYVGYLTEEEIGDKAALDYGIYETKYGRSGLERQYDEYLSGARGAKLIEVDSKGRVVSESTQRLPVNGNSIVLSIDAEMQSRLYEILDSVGRERGFKGGAGVILDVESGEALSITSWPEYDSELLSSGGARTDILSLLKNPANPLFFRAVSGLYSPGSVVKPILALGALQEGVISPEKSIFSAGSISIPNPYDSTKYSVFKDWKAHGWVDMRRAIAVSSNVYFFTIGGGYEGVSGLGASRIKKYMEMLGLGSMTGIDIAGEADGFIPSPEWKMNSDADTAWRIGDTYNLSIGQGGIQVTPLQMARVAALIAGDGEEKTPHLLKVVKDFSGKIIYEYSSNDNGKIDISQNYFSVVKEGMLKAVREGTAAAVSGLGIEIAGKTGTAELGSAKQQVNSWFIGFLPYENPKLAIAIVLERGDVHNLVGAPYAARQLLEWIKIERPEYARP